MKASIQILKASILIIILILIIIFSTISCGVVDKSISPEKMEELYRNNQDLFNEVKQIVDKKRIEQKSDYIFINDEPEEFENTKYRIFLTLRNNKSKRIEKLTDVFSEDDSKIIEKIFKMQFIYIEENEGRCSFAEQGLLDCHNEILYTPKKVEEYIAGDDDQIVKKLNDNWLIYGVR